MFSYICHNGKALLMPSLLSYLNSDLYKTYSTNTNCEKAHGLTVALLIYLKFYVANLFVCLILTRFNDCHAIILAILSVNVTTNCDSYVFEAREMTESFCMDTGFPNVSN